MKGLLIFTAGVGVGAGTTWYFIKKHYEKIADEEIKDVVTKFKKAREEIEKKYEGVPDENESPRKEDAITISRDSEELSNGYIDHPSYAEIDNDSINIENRPYEKDGVAPYIITDEEFGDNEDYDQVTLFWYYKDNILATDEDLEIENKETTIGNALEEFKKDKYIERICVRNENDETDYEILISEKHFYEVSGGDTE